MSRTLDRFPIAVAAGVILLVLLVPYLSRLPAEARVRDAGTLALLVEEAIAHGPGTLSLQEEERGLALHLTRPLGPILTAAGLGTDGHLRFSLPRGLRLVRVEGVDRDGVPLCRSLQCRNAEPGWVRWVLRGARPEPEIWVTVARTGESDVRVRWVGGKVRPPLVHPAEFRGH